MITLNGDPIIVTYFPDKTSQVWKLQSLPDMNFAYIKWDFENESEFMHLAQLKTLLDREKIQAYLRVSYLPYARQDKEVSNESTFALHTFSKLLNILKFKEIFITDPHSLIALELIDRSSALYPINIIEEIVMRTKPALLCYPDKGAKSKYTEMLDIYKLPYVYGEKQRDQLTGNILNYKLIGDPKDKRVLIIDDICDFGRTFTILTKDLISAGAKEVNLFVSHGLFSGGLGVLKDAGINRIFTKLGEAHQVDNKILYKEIV